MREGYYDMKHDRPIAGVTQSQGAILQYDNFIKVFCGGLFLLQEKMDRKDKAEDLFKFVHRLFSVYDPFDKCAVYFIRKLTSNFLQDYEINRQQINGLPINIACIADAKNMEDYTEDIIMKFGSDAMGVLLLIVPIILKINIHIVNINTDMRQRDQANF